MAISRFSAGASALAAAFVAVPLLFVPGLPSVFLLPKQIFCSLLPLVWFLERYASDASSQKKERLSSAIDVPLALFVFAAGVSTVFSVDSRLSWFGEGFDILFSGAGVLGCVAAFYWGCAQARGEGFAYLLPWICAGAIGTSFLALLQMFGLDIFDTLYWSVVGRVSSTFGNPVALGAYLAMTLPLSLHLICSSEKKKAPRALGLIALGISAIALIATASRGAWLGGAGGLALYGAARWYKDVRLKRFLPWAAAVVLALLWSAAALRGASVLRMSDAGRWSLWSMAVEEFGEHPWFGAGVDTFSLTFAHRQTESLARNHNQGKSGQNHAHNDWLQILATMGLMGGAAFAWLHILAGREALKSLHKDSTGLTAALCAGVAVLLIQAKFNSPSFATAWLGAVLAGGVLAQESSLSRRTLAGYLVMLAVFASAYIGATRAFAGYSAAQGAQARAQGRMRAAAEYYEQAVLYGPDMSLYRYDFVNLLWDAAGGKENGPSPQRPVLLKKAADLALEGIQLHPLSFNMYRLLGEAELKRTLWGGEDRLEQAAAAFYQAYLRGPNFSSTLIRLSYTAELQGELDKKKEWDERLKRIGG